MSSTRIATPSPPAIAETRTSPPAGAPDVRLVAGGGEGRPAGDHDDGPSALGAHVAVPAGWYSVAARTLEWSRLEPGVVDEKFYVPGIGVVKELAASGPKEVARLVRYSAE